MTRHAESRLIASRIAESLELAGVRTADSSPMFDAGGSTAEVARSTYCADRHPYDLTIYRNSPLSERDR